jgi:hypothetical protein
LKPKADPNSTIVSPRSAAGRKGIDEDFVSPVVNLAKTGEHDVSVANGVRRVVQANSVDRDPQVEGCHRATAFLVQDQALLELVAVILTLDLVDVPMLLFERLQTQETRDPGRMLGQFVQGPTSSFCPPV